MATNGIPAPRAGGTRLEALRKEVFDCSRCGFCRIWDWKGVDYVCPTYPYTEGYDTQYARGRVNMAQAILKGEAEVDETFLEHLAQCTLCGSCGVHCPVEMPLLEIWSAMRADLVDAGYMTENQRTVRDNTVQHHSIFGPNRRPANAAAPRKVDVLYFPGCQTTRKARYIGNSTTQLLDKLGVDYAMLEEDACCGYPLYDIGQMDAMKQAAEYTLAKIQAYQPDVVLTTCAGCFRAFSVVYPELLGLDSGLNFQHTHDFFPQRLAGKLHAIDRTVTYHDPCVMGRHMGHLRRAARNDPRRAGSGVGRDVLQPRARALLRRRRRHAQRIHRPRRRRGRRAPPAGRRSRRNSRRQLLPDVRRQPAALGQQGGP